MIAKTIVIKGKFERIRLTEEEENRVMDNLLSKNIIELERIVKKLTETPNFPERINPLLVIDMLFQKQSFANFTAITTALDDKVAKLKDDERVEKDRKYEEPKIHLKSVGKPVPAPKEPIQSMVEEAFEKEAFGKENNDTIIKELKKGM